ncbi:MAG: ribosome maturation factor [Desulfuromonas sp.]|nr:MAG: ribosome maturation factor [Desulfuromonas sp.]
MTHKSVQEQLEELLEPVLEGLGFELVDLEYRREERGWVVRLFVDRETGVNLDDCVQVSREVGVLLEVEDPVPHAYHLEVSSPGMDRVLKKPRDFERFVGQSVKVKTLESLDPDGRGHQRKTFAGELLGLFDGQVKILQQDSKGGEVTLPFAQIERANLDPKF